VIVTGKGGVGKSTVALAMGLSAAAEGRRTIVCEVSSQEHTSHVFNRAEVGFHEVEMAENLWAISIDPDQAMRDLKAMSPQKRLIEPEEVASLVAMLCSDEARGIHGQAIPLDGGQVMA
jgi:anion-transporting  ArsA/GET3 family ATPase